MWKTEIEWYWKVRRLLIKHKSFINLTFDDSSLVLPPKLRDLVLLVYFHNISKMNLK